MPNGFLFRMNATLGPKYMPVVSKPSIQSFFPRNFSSFTRGTTAVSSSLAKQFGMTPQEFQPLGTESSLTTDLLSALTSGKWKVGSVFDSNYLRSASSGGSITTSGLSDFAKLLLQKADVNGMYGVNDASSFDANGHLYVYSGPLMSASSGDLGRIQSWGKNNLIRAFAGTFPIGSQELTPQQVADAYQKLQDWLQSTSPASPDGSVDIFPTSNPIASQILQQQRWSSKSEIDGNVFLLGRANMVTINDSFFNLTNDGKLVSGATFTAMQGQGLHALAGNAQHMGVFDLINGVYRDVVVGSGKNPSVLLDATNNPLALAMWWSRGRLFDTFLKNADSIMKEVGSSGFSFNADTLGATMKRLEDASPISARTARFLQVFDGLSPLLSQGDNLAKFVESANQPPTPDESSTGDSVSRREDLTSGDGNPSPDTDRQDTIKSFNDMD
jgi:hypothetical protein